ncbi:MAG: helix-turn-helix domain-containing protein [Pseudomonadota bacterium]
MTKSTRDQLLETARGLFAERGYYGVSIANIADELGLTKQALLYHFPNKDKLYGEVLHQISMELDAKKQAAQASSASAEDQLKALLHALLPDRDDDAVRIRLLMRELLDNVHRASAVETWYLKPFLMDIIDLVKSIGGWSRASDSDILAFIYQLLGAVNYYAISEPTLRGIFGRRRFNALKKAFAPQLDAMVDSAIRQPLRPQTN